MRSRLNHLLMLSIATGASAMPRLQWKPACAYIQPGKGPSGVARAKRQAKKRRNKRLH